MEPTSHKPGALAERVLILAPVGRDAAVLSRKLREVGIVPEISHTIGALCDEIRQGAGTAVIAEEALSAGGLQTLRGALGVQEEWSDFPLIVMTSGGEGQDAAQRILGAIEGAGHALLLERPVRTSTLVNAVRVALESRRRQYQLRDLQRSLEQQVIDRTARLEQQAAELRRLALELSQTEQRERRRLASVLHDHLQQLLVAAKMRLSTLRARSGDEEAAAEAVQISDLITEAIKAAKDLSVELRPPVLYEDGLAAALTWLKQQMDERYGLEVKLEVDEGADPSDEQVRALLFEAIRELLLNAIKHAGVGEVAVTLGRPRANRLEVVIRDHGRGCDLGALSASDGGFGLFSIRERLAALGGEAAFRSEPGAGFEARLCVPVIEEVASDWAIEALTAREQDQRSVGRQRREAAITVVLADDHTLVRQGIAAMLKDTGDIEVVGQADDGEEAVRLVQQHQPDVVVLDVNMPRMNGIEAARIIRQRWPEVRIIGLSVQDDQAIMGSMLAAGAHGYVVKGCAASELIQSVRELTSSGETAVPAASHSGPGH